MGKRTVFFSLLIIMICLFTINVNADDYSDDIYDGNYSIEDMLANYNVITFGKKELYNDFPDNNSFAKGDLRILHINGSFLINGTLRKKYSPNYSENYLRIDLRKKSNNIHSYLKDIDYPYVFCGYYTNSSFSECYKDYSNIYSNISKSISFNSYGYSTKNTTIGTYMNFDRLYDSITNLQKDIRKGKSLNPERTLHIETGGYYSIDDISSVEDIIFDNFEKNKDEITVITINNSGAINFPKLFNGTNYKTIPTNDHIDMLRPSSSYSSFYVQDTYYGNIVWNVPNANYIYFRDGTPFVGHLIAPNADVYSMQKHAAGAFLVNSLSFVGNSELHYYPLTKSITYGNPVYKAIKKVDIKKGDVLFANDIDLNSLAEGTTVSFKVDVKEDYILTGLSIKDEDDKDIAYKEKSNNEYEFTMPATNVVITPQFREKNIVNIITNPKTSTQMICIVAGIFVIMILGVKIVRKKKIS